MINIELQRAIARAKPGNVVTFNAPAEVEVVGNRTAIKSDVLHTGVIKEVLPHHFLVSIGIEEPMVARTNILSVGA